MIIYGRISQYVLQAQLQGGWQVVAFQVLLFQEAFVNGVRQLIMPLIRYVITSMSHVMLTIVEMAQQRMRQMQKTNVRLVKIQKVLRVRNAKTSNDNTKCMLYIM